MSLTTTSVPSGSSSGSSSNRRCRGHACCPVVDEEPRVVTAPHRALRDQPGRQLVVELGRLHPTGTLPLAPMTDDAIDRARERLREAAEGRPDAAAVDAALERARAQVEELAETAAEPRGDDPGEGRACGSATASARRYSRSAATSPRSAGSMNQVIRRLERVEGDLLSERHARIDDLALLVDLITSGWKSVDDRLATPGAHDPDRRGRDRLPHRRAPRRLTPFQR